MSRQNGQTWEATEGLFALRDTAYADFTAKSIPSVPREKFIGVRTPVLRKFEKEYAKTEEAPLFLRELPHRYYEENALHGFLISGIKDYETCLAEVERFLPYVDNWAVCDSMAPKAFEKNRDKLIAEIPRWIASKETYVCRFGMSMLMRYYLDEDFRPEYLELPASVRSDEYYVNMMVAWFFATALAKQWDATIPYVEQGRLERRTHNKTIQKAVESCRITPEQKEYLKKLRKRKETREKTNG